MINDLIILGKIGSSHGISGWMHIFSFTEKIENIFSYQPWFIKKSKNLEQINIELWKFYKNKLIIKIKNIKDRESAKLLTNYYISIYSTQLPILDTGEYYLKDLIGCRVWNINNFFLGTVVKIIETRANDILVVTNNIKNNLCTQELLIPFLYKKIIKNVNIFLKIIQVNWSYNSNF